MPPRLKLGLIGAGPVSTRWVLPALRAVPEVLPYIVADIDDTRAQTIARSCPFCHTTNDFGELCDKVELAVVALPNHLHQPVACQLLEAGVHVLCVKPMARNVDECLQMIASAERGKSLLAVGHHRRFRTNFRQAQELVAKGLIGRIVRLEAEEGSVSDWPRSAAYFDAAIAGGGALLDLGVHSIDLIRWFAGEFTSVTYSGNQTDGTVESEAEVHFELEGGVNGRMLFSRDRNLRNEVRVVGTEGAISVGLWAPDIVLQRDRGKAFSRFPSLQVSPVHRAMDASYVDLLLHFVNCIRGSRQLEVNGVEGLRAVEVVQWAYQGLRPVARAPRSSQTVLGCAG